MSEDRQPAAAKKVPSVSTKKVPVPKATEPVKELPEEPVIDKAIPTEPALDKEMPREGNPENCVTIDGKTVEIKATKLKYQRNRMSTFYRVLDIYPLPDILSMEAGMIDAERDGDKCLFDFLCAVFDDPKFVKAHYDNMDSDLIEKILVIFKRVNHIDEKEEQLKNRQAKATNH